VKSAYGPKNPKFGATRYHTWQTMVDIKCTCISYSLAYLKYLNKYPLTANVSTYVEYANTFVSELFT
jgi:hypothetical protein